MDSNDLNLSMTNLSFEKFRQLAKDDSLSRHEKVGFPDSYREGKEEEIFRDIRTKLKTLESENSVVLEIGPGCSRLPLMLQDLCHNRNSKLIFVDSEEMLTYIPDRSFTYKYSGQFPDALGDDMRVWKGRVRTILVYSVIQYVIAGGDYWKFIDCCLELLVDGGELLFGDLPNATMRSRFFDSREGKASHEEFARRNPSASECGESLEKSVIDDQVVLSILDKVRSKGFHCWALPQAQSLPFANRREDVLIKRP